MPLANALFLLAIFDINLSQRASEAIRHGGPLVLFGLLFTCGLGVPIPEDIPLLVAGAMVGRGEMSFAAAAICAWLGIIGGDCILYHLGKIFGLEITRIPVIGKHVTHERIRSLEAKFERYGIWVVGVGRMFAGIRGAMVVCAGAIKFPLWKFLIADGLAAIVSGGLFLMLGYWFGRNMDELQHHVEKAKRWTFLGFTIIVAIGVGWWWINNRRRRAGHGNRRTETDKPTELPPQEPVAPAPGE